MSEERLLPQNPEKTDLNIISPSSSKDDPKLLKPSGSSRLLTGVSYAPTYGATISNEDEIIVVGACPACRIGILETEYSYLCVCCFLCCFPFGLGKHRKCNNCGAYFG